MPSNFDFLRQPYPDLHEHASHAESLAYSAPRASCFYTRFTLEQAVQWLYANEPYLKLPYDNSLGALIHEQTFQDNLKPGLFPKLRLIQKMGNTAVHSNVAITPKDALHLLKELFHFLYWLCRYYTPKGAQLPNLTFNSELITQTKQEKDLSLERLQELEKQLSLAQEMQRIAEEKQRQTEAQLKAQQAQITAVKEKNYTVKDPHNYNEAETRLYLIDVFLKEAGWQLDQPEVREYEVRGMPNSSGKGYVDYVLWGNDGKPLAVVEAKGSSKNPERGKTQAKFYADCLEKQFQQRPVIFYSNGYKTWIWDDTNYPPRLIAGFLKKDELERLIFRRSKSKKLHLVETNPTIVDRCYQKEAIKRISETLTNKGRKALLVMATGTGKTRTAIALVDLLMKANWVKRVLFLADRNALLTQAQRAFKTHLPQATTIDLTKDKAAETATVVLSTYPTMFNRINNLDGEGGLFGAGHFDLVIIDEAHRSVYKKYAALFDYFDSLLIGLTATPRKEIHRDTYGIFDLESGVPTFAYELEDGIKDGYLVPPKGVQVSLSFLDRGIRYQDLSPQEQEEYEEKFQDPETGEIPDQVDASALNNWLFNRNTVDQALELLMEKGLKTEGGDRLGKTIIFSRNHEHADFIVKRFDHNYPQYQGKFAQVIDSHNNYAHALLDEFSNPHKEPTIAVSVDMLDTGVDVPEVVNLVFFKPVYSRVKFNQMIGRGTRLCPNLFGMGQDKTEFLVFDLCKNFQFFAQGIPETNVKPQPSLTTQLVRARLQLSQLLKDPPDPDQKELRKTLLNDLHRHINSMEKNNFLVRRHLQEVETFAKRDRWENLQPEDLMTISTSLAPLPNGLPRENPLAKRFDLLCLKLQLSILENHHNFINLRDKVRDTLNRLGEKQNVPMVKEKLSLIEEVQVEGWWANVTPWMVEYVRLELRDLIKFIDRPQQNIVETNFIDELTAIDNPEVPLQQTGFSPYQYKKKVRAYIKANENHVAIAKLKRNLPLTPTDLESLEEMLFNSPEIEGKERFEEVYGQNVSLQRFIREIVGLDRNAAKQAFSKYLEQSQFSANQIRFVEEIIDQLTQKGIIDPGILYEPPFTDLHQEGLDGVFTQEADADNIITIISSFNRNADDGFSLA